MAATDSVAKNADIPNGWIRCTVQDIVHPEKNSCVGGPFGSNLTSKDYVDVPGVPVSRGNNMTLGEERYLDRDFVFVSERKAATLVQNTAFPGDLVFTQRGTIGQIGLIPRKARFSAYILSQNQMKLRPDEATANSVFLYYYFISPVAQNLIQQNSIGSTIPGFNLGQLRAFPLVLPPLPEQHAIAHILGTLEDKIELNQRMNETLKAMTRALFKSWFVDFDPVRAKAEGRDSGLPKPLADLFPDSFEDSELGEIPKGWNAGPLSAFFKVGIGGAWGNDEPSERTPVSIRCLRGIDCHELAEGQIPEVPIRWLSAKQAADRTLTDGAILIEGSGSFCGRSLLWDSSYGSLVGEPASYSNFCKRLDPLCTASQAAVCWLQMRNAYRTGELHAFRTGTAFPNFDIHGTLASLLVVAPPEPVANAFAQFFRLSRRVDLMGQGRTLAALRDTLLPKLISGEVRVTAVKDLAEVNA